MSSETEMMETQLFNADRERNLAITPKAHGEQLWIRCPYHGNGQESTPSCCVTVSDNSNFFKRFVCYGCGKKGSFNDLAEVLGMQKLDKNFKAAGLRRLSFRDKQRATEVDPTIKNFRLSTFDWPKDRDWRSIPAKTVLLARGALTDVRHDLEEPRLAFPVRVWNETVGWVYALLHAPKRDDDNKKVELAYLFSSTAESGSRWKEHSVYGFDLARKRMLRNPDRPLWIVEGLRDCLWLVAAGCAVVATLGSSFSKEKAELVKLLNPKRILVASDADEAGDKLAESILDHLHKHHRLTRVRFKDGQDPCDISQERLRAINARYVTINPRTPKVKTREKIRCKKIDHRKYNR